MRNGAGKPRAESSSLTTLGVIELTCRGIGVVEVLIASLDVNFVRRARFHPGIEGRFQFGRLVFLFQEHVQLEDTKPKASVNE